MRTKLALLLALCRGAELLILDEPTAGLDPAMTEEVLQALVAHVASEEMTVFFSSHQIAEVDQIADQRRDHRSRPRGGGRRARRRCGSSSAASSWCSTATRRIRRSARRASQRVRRKGRVLTVLSSAGAERIVDEARRAQPVSVDVVPVTLERDLSRDRYRGGLTCSGHTVVARNPLAISIGFAR